MTSGDRLLSLGVLFSRFSRVVAGVSPSFLLGLNNILLCGWTTSGLSIYLLVGIRVVSIFGLL